MSRGSLFDICVIKWRENGVGDDSNVLCFGWNSVERRKILGLWASRINFKVVGNFVKLFCKMLGCG